MVSLWDSLHPVSTNKKWIITFIYNSILVQLRFEEKKDVFYFYKRQDFYLMLNFESCIVYLPKGTAINTVFENVEFHHTSLRDSECVTFQKRDGACIFIQADKLNLQQDICEAFLHRMSGEQGSKKEGSEIRIRFW